MLENRIDEMDAELAPIKQFILPGGTANAAATHVCRSVCRNAERRILSYLSALTATKNDEKERDAVGNGMNSTGLDSALPRFEVILKYMNRLSDYFFVLARFLNLKEKCTDVFWKPIDQS
jgi:cob(I)alamin adenosyltransferase